MTVDLPRPMRSWLPGRAVDAMPTGTGKRRGSTIVSEMAVTLKNQSSPQIGRSP